MHDTLIKDVKLHVDEVSSNKDNVVVKGWCASNSTKIKKVRLFANKDFSFDGEYGKKREDVYKFYDKNDKFLNSGFAIPVTEKLEDSEDIFLQVYL